ncbi:glycosyl hydrolase family 18 protein [Bacillus dakarensis]|uniref:glycosyl hydrolase family 18 protein n=1 Tax=Robertmurraya dakarensis TaxID=1926278 RepID=UPI0009818FE6|nr:glycosyl hydrolase family 18 protein [Bacillus dakarensis]
MSRVEYYKKKPVTRGWILAGLLAAFLMCVSSILLLLYPFASSDKSAYFEGEHPIIFNGEQAGNAILNGESVYVPLDFMKEYIDDSITFDEKSNSIIVTTKDKVVQMPTESLTYYVNETPVELHFSPIIDEEGVLFVSLDPIINFYAVQYEVLPDSNGVWVQKDGDEFTHGKITNESVHEELLRLRTETSIRSAYTAQVYPNEPIFIESENEDFYFVRKEDGTAGYLGKKYVTVGETEKITVQREQKEVSLPEIKGPIQLTWEAVYTKNPNTEMIPKMPGVNIVSPTWFELGDETGEIYNLASLDYVHWAKKQGYQVWGLFSNAFDPELTYLAFKDFETRQKMIRQLLHYSQMYELDGINLDIENVNPEHGPLVTQFVREATPYFHEAGLIVSMDITFIAGGNWSAFYERDKLASIVDYLIVMAYDEHWGSSPVAGSVSSFPWVESNLKKLLEMIPNEKLVLGVPLYTRLWAESDSGEVSSKALSMQEVKKWLTENGLTPAYDEGSGQNYAELYVEEEKTTYKVWLEDELSLRKRAELAQTYELAGIASWSRYFADETAWTALNSINQQVTQK